jgi:hypothetical protein
MKKLFLLSLLIGMLSCETIEQDYLFKIIGEGQFEVQVFIDGEIQQFATPAVDIRVLPADKIIVQAYSLDSLGVKLEKWQGSNLIESKIGRAHV